MWEVGRCWLRQQAHLNSEKSIRSTWCHSQFFIQGKCETTLWQSLEKYYSQEKLAIKCCIILFDINFWLLETCPESYFFLKTLQNDTYASQEPPLKLFGGHPPYLNTSVLQFQIDVKTERCTQDLAMTHRNVIYGTLWVIPFRFHSGIRSENCKLNRIAEVWESFIYDLSKIFVCVVKRLFEKNKA